MNIYGYAPVRYGRQASNGEIPSQNRLFPLGVDYIYLRYTYWLQDCLFCFGNILKKVGLYEMVWASQFTMPLSDELLKAFTARWCPRTDTVHACYGDLGISYR